MPVALKSATGASAGVLADARCLSMAISSYVSTCLTRGVHAPCVEFHMNPAAVKAAPLETGAIVECRGSLRSPSWCDTVALSRGWLQAATLSPPRGLSNEDSPTRKAFNPSPCTMGDRAFSVGPTASSLGGIDAPRHPLPENLGDPEVHPAGELPFNGSPPLLPTPWPFAPSTKRSFITCILCIRCLGGEVRLILAGGDLGIITASAISTRVRLAVRSMSSSILSPRRVKPWGYTCEGSGPGRRSNMTVKISGWCHIAYCTMNTNKNHRSMYLPDSARLRWRLTLRCSTQLGSTKTCTCPPPPWWGSMVVHLSEEPRVTRIWSICQRSQG